MIAAASASVKEILELAPPRTPPATLVPLRTKSTFSPSPCIVSSMLSCAPLPTPTMAITALTPIMIPSVVNAVRSLLARSELTALSRLSLSFMMCLVHLR